MTDPINNPNAATPPPPNRLNYQTSSHPQPSLPPTSAAQTLRWFFIGLVSGTALSAVVWIFAFKSMESSFAGSAMVGIPILKLGSGITFLCLRGWRSLGAGILVSLALGFLIFFGICAMHLGDMH